MISHFHGDHINGLRLKDGTARFPKAEIMVPAVEWAYWTNEVNLPNTPERQRPNFANTKRVFGPIMNDVKRFDWDKELMTGINSIAAPGHTPGHTAFAIHSGNARLFAMQDLTNNPVLFVRNPDWGFIGDLDAELARKSRHRLLDMAVSERAQASFYHAAFPATGFIVKDGARFQMVPVAWQPAI